MRRSLATLLTDITGEMAEDRSLVRVGLRENRIIKIEVRVKIIVSRNFVLKGSRKEGQYLMGNMGVNRKFYF